MCAFCLELFVLCILYVQCVESFYLYVVIAVCVCTECVRLCVLCLWLGMCVSCIVFCGFISVRHVVACFELHVLFSLFCMLCDVSFEYCVWFCVLCSCLLCVCCVWLCVLCLV